MMSSSNLNLNAPIGADYSKYSETELDNEIIDSRDEVEKAQGKLNRELKQRLIPALKEMRNRYKKPGARTDLKPLPEPSWEQYLTSRGLKPDTVRNWFQQSDAKQAIERIVATTATSGKHPGGSRGSGRFARDTETVPTTSASTEDEHEYLTAGLPAHSSDTDALSGRSYAEIKQLRLYEVDVSTVYEGLKLLVKVYLVDSDEQTAKDRAEFMVESHAEVPFEEINATHVRVVDHVLVGEYVDSRGHSQPPSRIAKRRTPSFYCPSDPVKTGVA